MQRPAFRPFRARTKLEATLLSTLHSVRRDHSGAVYVEASQRNRWASAAFLRWFLLEAVVGTALPICRCTLRGARISGQLDLLGAEMRVAVRFEECEFPKGIDLTDAQVRSFEMVGGSVHHIRAERMRAAGVVALRTPLAEDGADLALSKLFTIQSRAMLSGAELHGSLDMRGCSIGADLIEDPARAVLNADRARIRGNVLLSHGFMARGAVSFNGAAIGGSFDCSGAYLCNPLGCSLSALGARIDGSLYTRSSDHDQFRSIGGLQLSRAVISMDWFADGASFCPNAFYARQQAHQWMPSGQNRHELNAIVANGIEVGATVSFSGFRSQGVVRLTGAKVHGDLYIANAELDFPGEEALYAEGIVVDGACFINEVRISGLLRLVQSVLRHGLYIEAINADFRGTFRDWLGDDNVSAEEIGRNRCGVLAREAHIGGTFYWKQVTKGPGDKDRRLWLSL